MRFIRETDEVYRTADPQATVDAADIVVLKHLAAQNARRRVRLCAHVDSAERVHEMVIVLGRTAYVTPHKHTDKTESYHVIEGRLTIFLFDDAGTIQDAIPMGDVRSGRVFFHRLMPGVYHSLVSESEQVVFHEVTNGPFDGAATTIAPWAPSSDDSAEQQRFVAALALHTARRAIL